MLPVTCTKLSANAPSFTGTCSVVPSAADPFDRVAAAAEREQRADRHRQHTARGVGRDPHLHRRLIEIRRAVGIVEGRPQRGSSGRPLAVLA